MQSPSFSVVSAQRVRGHDLVVDGDGEMGAGVFQLVEQRADARRRRFLVLAVHGQAHRITWLSIAPRVT